MSVSFSRTTTIPAPIEVAYRTALDVDFHEDAFAHTREQAIGGVTSGVMQEGQEVTWRAVHWHIPFTMTSRITLADPPHRFVDEQVRGPFAWFYHDHRLRADGPARTVAHDAVAFAAPLGPLGRIAEALFVRRRIEELIDIRNAEMVRRFAGSGMTVPAAGQPGG